jgi:hypothetical protein
MSTIKVDTIKTTGNVEVYTCKAWVNFDGTQTAGNMIRASGNVSSITDNGTGDYTITFITAMTDANYSFSTSSFEEATTGVTTIEAPTGGVRTASALQVQSAIVSSTVNRTTRDNELVSIQVIR